MDPEKLAHWVKGNESAYSFLAAYGDASQALDDLCDEDLSPGERSNLCLLVGERFLAGMFANAFFQNHAQALTPVLLSGLMEWHASNAWRTDNNETLRTFGYVRREAGDSLIAMCAYLIGGREWAVEVAKDIAVYFHADQESISDWAKE